MHGALADEKLEPTVVSILPFRFTVNDLALSTANDEDSRVQKRDRARPECRVESTGWSERRSRKYIQAEVD